MDFVNKKKFEKYQILEQQKEEENNLRNIQLKEMKEIESKFIQLMKEKRDIIKRHKREIEYLKRKHRLQDIEYDGTLLDEIQKLKKEKKQLRKLKNIK